MRWSLVAITSLVCGAAVCRPSSIPDVPTAWNVEITGEDFEWHIRYAGTDQVLHTQDDLLSKRHLTMVVGVPTVLALRSNDYVYNFALPHLNQKEIAVPDLAFSLEFAPMESGEFVLEGDQMCGYQHPNLIGRVRVLDPIEFARWQQTMHSEVRNPSRN